MEERFNYEGRYVTSNVSVSFYLTGKNYPIDPGSRSGRCKCRQRPVNEYREENA